jgi:hypothetical protein
MTSQGDDMQARFCALADYIVQSGGSTCFSTEALESLRIMPEVIRPELQGDKPTKLGVLSLVHHTHADPASR